MRDDLMSCGRIKLVLLFVLPFVVRLLYRQYDLLSVVLPTDHITQVDASSQAIARNDTLSNAPNDSCEFVQIVVLNNRPKTPMIPLKGLINSLLAHSTRPIRLTIATNKPARFLNGLTRQSVYFQISIQNSTRLEIMSKQLTRETGFQTMHHAGLAPMQKLFVTALDFPPGTKKVLLIDDDFIFFQDVALLWDALRKEPTRLDFYCPFDAERVRKYFVKLNRTDNGHDKRYCNSGLMGLPVVADEETTEDTIALFRRMTQDMMQQYPAAVFRVSDQEVVNRILGPKGLPPSRLNFIPCHWGCDKNSCQEGMTCSTCPEECAAYHFLDKAYQKPPLKGLNETQQWKHYFEQTSHRLIKHVFEPRVKSLCDKSTRVHV